MKRITLILLLCLSPLAPATMAPEAAFAGETRVVTDQVGRSVRVPAHPQRVVSLIPSLTEIAFELGRGDVLVGATQYAKEPPAAAELPRVGSYLHLDVERIVALRPDLCIGVRDGNPEHLIQRIEKMNIPVYAFDPQTLPEIIESVRLLGELLGARDKAEEIAATMERKMSSVAERVERIENRPGVFFLIDASPMVSAGSGTFIDRLIVMAGGRNLAAGKTSYPRYSWEDILVLKPEIVIIASMAGGYSEKQLKDAWRKWPGIPAVENDRLYVVDANLFDRPLPRLADGLVELVNIFHPGDAGQ